MKTIRKIWDSIPIFDEIIERINQKVKNENNAFWLTVTLFAIYLLIDFFIPTILNFNYYTAILGLVISIVMTFFLLIFVGKDFLTTPLNINRPELPFKYRKWISRGFVVFAFVELVLSLFLFMPSMAPDKNTNTIPQSNTTYLTYSPTCEYCQAAHNATEQAVNIYNQTHKDKIKVVNIDKETKLSEAIIKSITSKGSVIHYDKNGKPLMATTYTIGDKKGPLKPSASEVYQSLIQGSHGTMTNNEMQHMHMK